MDLHLKQDPSGRVTTFCISYAKCFLAVAPASLFLALRWRSSASAATAFTKANIFDEVVPATCSCPACGGERLSKMGEDITETLEAIHRSWKLIQTVPEKYEQHQSLNRRADRLACDQHARESKTQALFQHTAPSLARERHLGRNT
jgi:hypothetical protein